jgi:cytochrome c peroxidase
MMQGSSIVAAFCLLILATACQDQSRTQFQNVEDRSSEDFEWNIPSNIPLPPIPEDKPMSEGRFQLGRHLFYDQRLSGNGTQSCASCHQQDKSFTDGRAQAIGSTGELHPRSSMALVNIAYVPTLTWGNPNLRHLEQQILMPLFGENPVEQGITESSWPSIIEKLRTDAMYPLLFAGAFPNADELFTRQQIVDSLAVFVRGLLSFNSPFDKFQRGASDALSASAQRGRQLYFSERMECFHCHGSYNLTDSNVDRTMSFVERPFHNTGLFNIGGRGDYPNNNRGIFELTQKASDMGKFRALSLRNIELTAPYMHDGSIGTLPEVLDFYAAGGRQITEGINAGDGRKNPFKDGFVTGFAMDPEEKADLIEFLKSFTDREFVTNPRFANPWSEL